MVAGVAELCRGLAAEVARGGLEPEVWLPCWPLCEHGSSAVGGSLLGGN